MPTLIFNNNSVLCGDLCSTMKFRYTEPIQPSIPHSFCSGKVIIRPFLILSFSLAHTAFLSPLLRWTEPLQQTLSTTLSSRLHAGSTGKSWYILIDGITSSLDPRNPHYRGNAYIFIAGLRDPKCQELAGGGGGPCCHRAGKEKDKVL